ncbi:hypothetical protein, partial [Bradyrhizobium sp.]|uniref:hypothetical protein n=1 Tax=Bradyrhizobium sp. TaxID=376 RepID=UPI003C49C1AA
MSAIGIEACAPKGVSMRYVTITAAVLIIAAPSAYAAEQAGRPASADQQFVDQAANINLLEIDAAHQAEQKAA